MENENADEKKFEFVKAQPEILPNPTYVPFLMAISILFVGWGLISTWIICVAGLLGMGISIGLWIKELLYES